MKILSFINNNVVVRGLLVAALFSFGLQNRLFAPPAIPVPTYYGEALGDYGAGSFIDIYLSMPTDTIGDYDIMTPDGDLTPQNSEITSGGSFPASSFFDIFTDISIDPITILPTNGPYNGDPVTVDLGTAGSITDSTGGVSDGVWSLPDHSDTWLLLLLGVGVLRLGAWGRRFRKA